MVFRTWFSVSKTETWKLLGRDFQDVGSQFWDLDFTQGLHSGLRPRAPTSKFKLLQTGENWANLCKLNSFLQKEQNNRHIWYGLFLVLIPERKPKELFKSRLFNGGLCICVISNLDINVWFTSLVSILPYLQKQS
jgi:hypothetical protein